MFANRFVEAAEHSLLQIVICRGERLEAGGITTFIEAFFPPLLSGSSEGGSRRLNGPTRWRITSHRPRPIRLHLRGPNVAPTDGGVDEQARAKEKERNFSKCQKIGS